MHSSSALGLVFLSDRGMNLNFQAMRCSFGLSSEECIQMYQGLFPFVQMCNLASIYQCQHL